MGSLLPSLVLLVVCGLSDLQEDIKISIRIPSRKNTAFPNMALMDLDRSPGEQWSFHSSRLLQDYGLILCWWPQSHTVFTSVKPSHRPLNNSDGWYILASSHAGYACGSTYRISPVQLEHLRLGSSGSQVCPSGSFHSAWHLASWLALNFHTSSVSGLMNEGIN